MGGGGDGDVPKGLDRPALFGLVDRGDCPSHLLAEALGEERAELILDLKLTRFRGARQGFNGGFSDAQDASALFT